MAATRRPIDRRPAADAAQEARAAQVVEHRVGGRRVERGEPDGDVVEDLGQDPAEPDEDGRPELRVAPQPEDQLDARAAPSARRAGRGRSRPCRRAGLEQVERGRVDRVVAVQAERDPAEVALVGEPDGIELERDRPADPPRGRDRGRARRRPRSPRSTAMPGRADEGEALALGQRDRRAGRGGRVGAGSAPYEVRSAASAGQPARHGPSVRRAARAAAPSARPRRSPGTPRRAPRRSGAPPPVPSSSAFVSGGGSPEVSDT